MAKLALPSQRIVWLAIWSPPPTNILVKLFQDDELRKALREIVYDAFKLYPVIDPTLLSMLRIRLSSTPPNADEQSLDAKARAFHEKAQLIQEASDGIRAFVGLISAVLAGGYKVCLIDEPEAFLHPPMAKKLGFQITSSMLKREGSLFAATHSSDFVIGCLQASSSVRVVRLSYAEGVSKGYVVDSDTLKTFYRKPLFRSANVISALFHDGVVVCESDNDRAFYSETYQRISEKEPGTPSILFVNAQNKHTIHSIIAPLRSFGVPAAGIADIDVLKDVGANWTNWMSAARIPDALKQSLGQQRGDLNTIFEKLKINMKSEGGVSALPESDAEAANDFFDRLSKYGIFVTRGGELEHWLKAFNIPGKGTEWTVAMLERLGADPQASGYVTPGNDDAWEFMRGIIAWVRDPNRKGMG